MHRLIDLAQPRKLTIRRAGWRRSLVIAPISQEIWFTRFFDKILFTVQMGRRENRSYIDIDSPLLQLLEATAIRADGYPNLAMDADWLSSIPLADRLTFGPILLEVLEVGESENALLSTLSPSRIKAVGMEALWGSTESGAMCRHRHLVHRFEKPTPEHRERYRRAWNSVKRTASVSRRGTAVFLAPEQPLAAHALAELYDELISSVEGYAFNGQVLGDDREKIVANMDAFHKVRAAGWLLSGILPEMAGRKVA